jgi:hypothetical protein
MSDRRGTFEHAKFAAPRVEHGYCTDDMARVLVVATRESGDASDVSDLVNLSLRFMEAALHRDGSIRNRMNRRGRWTDLPTVEDCWGRGVWGLGTAASRSDNAEVRRSALALFEVAVQQRSRWPRAMQFAALGAAEVLIADPGQEAARSLLSDAAHRMAGPTGKGNWPWPEERLTYANAVVPEAMIGAGVALERPDLLQKGLELLDWLIDHETAPGHLSVTPAGGRGRADIRPGFDQQPIEVAALADACARAALIDTRHQWEEGVLASIDWFMGANDAGAPMWDAQTGGGFDGLRSDGVNLNQGAESTLAFICTMQHARRLVAIS